MPKSKTMGSEVTRTVWGCHPELLRPWRTSRRSAWTTTLACGSGGRHSPFGPVDDVDKAPHNLMLELVGRMLDLHKRLSEVRTEHDKEVLRRQIGARDDEIDRQVYELYGLTGAEIKIVGGAGLIWSAAA